jgi:hypothetical protein
MLSKEYNLDKYDLAFTFSKTAGAMPSPKGDGWSLIDTKTAGAGHQSGYTVYAFFFWARKK